MRPTNSLTNTWRLAAAGLLVLLLSACGDEATDATRGSGPPGVPLSLWDSPQPVADVGFRDGAGQSLRLSDFHGEVVLVNVWATWCPPCREEMPTLDRLQGRLGGEDFEVIALSIDQAGPDVVRKFYDEIGVQHLRLYIDSSAAAANKLNAVGVPVTLLIDRDGRELGRLMGTAEWDSPEMVAFIERVIAGAADPAEH